MELWELSDGRVWVIEDRVKHWYVSSLLDGGGESRVGTFKFRSDIAVFAQEMLNLYVVCIVA